ncbi:MAG TPA: Rne/Rng family ribonuclease [Bryobacteraceae bacterium]
MSKELVIGSNRHETKVAILEEDQLVEVYFQRANEYSLAGSIHKGRVTRVLPGMQSAFVDLGLERDTFLYVSDFFEENEEEIDALPEDKPSNRPDRRDERRDRGPNRSTEAVAPPLVAVAAEAGESESRPPAASPATVVLPTGPAERRPVDRTDGDRGPRGDRRGRRSRRRRPHGRDFPDNKYAQPSPAAPSLEADRPEAEPRPQETPLPVLSAKEEPPADVMMLPGESLAKYRHKPVEQEPLPLASEASQAPEHEPDEDLAAEAEELELTDRVFAHHDEDSTPLPEEKIPEVETLLTEEERHSNVVSIRGDGREEPPFEPAGPEVEALEVSEPEVEALEVTEFDADPAEETLPEVEELAPEIEEALENAAGDVTIQADGPPKSSAPQTAAVRDQGGRLMHRVSRRMRRRRGGSRFAQGDAGNGAPGANEAAGASRAASGTAAAMEPEAKAEARRESYEERSAEKPERSMPSISELLKAGQEIIVQIAKEPLGQKGARITSHVALPGRFVVFMPSVAHLGVSRRVSSEEERHRLKRILQTHRVGTTGGFIIRTAGEGVPEEEIAADMNFLYNLWLDIRQKAEKKPAPALLHYDLDIVQRILRDQVTDEFKAIWVDNEELYENVVTFMQRFQPALVNRVKMYTRSAPIFDAFGITQELEKALRPKVWLKSGGYIVINQTEALVAIDINTGKYVGKSNRLEDTIVKTNIEAVKEIVRQIRLRDLGGIIVVDFIDMDERKNRQKVMQALEEAMRADKAPNKILQFNDFGLVAITRKRVKQSLERTLCSPCPHCEGAGYVKSVQTTISEILVEAQKIARAIEGKDVVLRVHPDVAKQLKASSNQYLEELEEILGRPVLVVGDATLHHEKFDLA